MRKDFELALKDFMGALNEVLKHFDKKQKKALELLLECDHLERQSKTMEESFLKALAYGYLLENDIVWEHSDFTYPEEFEQVWKVFHFGQ